MPKPVRVEPDAEAEMLAAADWYEQRRAGLGLEFLDEVEVGLEAIPSAASRCAPVPDVPAELGVKRFFIERFPYALVFIETANAFRVVAVAHARRRPGYWRRRL